MSDQELADKIVAHGVGKVVGYDDRGQERVVLYRVDREVGTPPDKFVRDWRVAGAMMEKVDHVELSKLPNGEWEASVYEEGRGLVFNESAPRAIIESCCEARNE